MRKNLSKYLFFLLCIFLLGDVTKAFLVYAQENPDFRIYFTSPTPQKKISGKVKIQIGVRGNSKLSRLEFWVDNKKINELYQPPWEMTWNSTGLEAGSSHEIKAVAMNSGGEKRQEAIRVVVERDDSPSILISEPGDCQKVQDRLNVVVTVSDDHGIDAIEFFADKEKIGRVTKSPYEFSWDTFTHRNGTVELKVVASDTIGQKSEDSVSIEIQNSGSRLSGLIANPLSGANVSGEVLIQLSAGENKDIGRVEFYADDKLLGARKKAPFEWIWDTVSFSDNMHRLKVMVYDRNNQQDSDEIQVMVNNSSVASQSANDLLGNWQGEGVFYLNMENSRWFKVTSEVEQLAVGDIDGDHADDVIWIWRDPEGVWVKCSKDGSLKRIAAARNLKSLACGDMDGDGLKDIVCSYNIGVFWRSSNSGAWYCCAAPANLICCGDFDGDGQDDLAGVFENGTWVRFSVSNSWIKLTSATTIQCLACGDMNGDKRKDLILGINGNVYSLDFTNGAWRTLGYGMARFAASDLDGDGTDDLITVDQSSGTQVRFSKTGEIQNVASAATAVAAGKISSGGALIYITPDLKAPRGGTKITREYWKGHEDYSSNGPGGQSFEFKNMKNLSVGSQIDEEGQKKIKPGPGERGFIASENRSTNRFSE